MKHIIYTTEPDFDQAGEYIEEEAGELKDTLAKLAEENWLGGVLANACEKRIEELKSEEAYSQADFWRECEQANLSQDTGEIVVLGDLGLWSGRVSGVKETGKHNLNAILDWHGDIDDFEVYEEDGEIKATAYHHDGTNYYTFREVIDEEKWQDLRDKIIAGEKYTIEELNESTKALGERVGAVYGW